MADTLRDEILTHLCRHREQMLLVVGLLGVFLLLTLVGFTVIASGTAAYVINAMNLAGLSLFFVFFSIILVYCYRSAPDRAYR